jgi:hypothetical protein
VKSNLEATVAALNQQVEGLLADKQRLTECESSHYLPLSALLVDLSDVLLCVAPISHEQPRRTSSASTPRCCLT